MGGMRLPSLIDWAFSIHLERFAGVFGTASAPIVRRSPTSLRFGPISSKENVGTGVHARPAEHSSAISNQEIHKNHSILEGVVSGVASYGNCFGVPK